MRPELAPILVHLPVPEGTSSSIALKIPFPIRVFAMNTLPAHGITVGAPYFFLDAQANSVSCRSSDIAIILNSLDIYLSECGKTEAGKIDFITYNRITDMAAMYRILAALRMHRPSMSLRYTYVEEVMKTRDSATWRLWRHKEKILEIMEDPQKFRFGTAFHNMERYRMPSGKKTEQWLDRADSAVSILNRLNLCLFPPTKL